MTENTPPSPESIAALRRAAEGGHPEAQYRLGMLHANGEGVDLNYSEGAAWIRRAAEQGLTEAQRTLSWLHASGYGVDQDDEAARRWLLAAAEGGDAAAQCAAAIMYQFGRHGATLDPEAMVHWYRRAADQYHPTALFALGKLLAAGEQVAEDTEAAFRLLTLAIMAGNESAQKELAMLTARLPAERLETYKARMLAEMNAEP